ncbi:MAG: hypothetical protein IPK59_04120 [Rhodospirillaceae bacterium]|nr:hypothetical protein [Rhodospirillaceae bacterium]
MASLLTVAVLTNAIVIVWWYEQASALGVGLWSESAAAWMQVIGTIDALVLAVLIPAWQRDKERQDRVDEHDKFVDAFGLVLLPTLKAYVESLQSDLDTNARQAEKEKGSKTNFYAHDDRHGMVQFFKENWEAVSRCDRRVVTGVAKAVAHARNASRHYSNEHDVWPIDEGDGTVWDISLGDNVTYLAYVADLEAALRECEAIVAFIEE